MRAVRKVDLGHHRVGKAQVCGPQIDGQLRHSGRPHDRNDRERPGQAEGQRHLAGVEPVARGDAEIGRRRRKDLRRDPPAERGIDRPPRAFRRHVAGVFARQDARRQRRKPQQRDIFHHRQFGPVGIELTAEQRIFVLHRRHPGQAVPVGQCQPFRRAPGGLIGQAKVADLAFGHQFAGDGQHLQHLRFDQRRVAGARVKGPDVAKVVMAAAWPVHLIKVDMVGLQAPQRRLCRLPQHRPVQRPAVAQRRIATAADLGGQHQPVAALSRGKPGADDFLGPPRSFGADRVHRIDLGGVPEVHPMIQRQIGLGMALGLGGLVAPGHGAEAQLGHHQIGSAQFDLSHRGPSRFGGR